MSINNIYLRALELQDLDLIYKWRQDPIYQNGIVSPFKYANIETERIWLESVISNHYQGKEVRLGIVDNKSGNLIGLIYLININIHFRSAEIGYLIGDESARGKGFSSLAISKVIDYGFNVLGLNRIGALVLEDNIPSLKALNRAKFVKEGVKREGAFKNGVFKNVIHLSLLKSDYYE